MNQAELADAETYLTKKIDSLENDLERAFVNIPALQVAPFPITMYTLSVLDNLSAILSGWGKTDRSLGRFQTSRIVDFCVGELHYPSVESKILVAIYRHSLMHTSQPQTITDQNGIVYGWSIANTNSSNMQFTTVPDLTGNPVSVLQIGLRELVADFNNYLFAPNGYVENLRRDRGLQGRFEDCMNEFNSETIRT